MQKLLNIVILVLLPVMAMAEGLSVYDQQKPFGYCCMSSRTDAGETYEVTGAGCMAMPLPDDADKAVLVSDGGDMRDAIAQAIKRHEVVVLDGSKGEFLISSSIQLSSLSNRTILGINGATLYTEWQVTDEIKQKMDAAGVKQMSGSAGTGGTLPNGAVINEEGEYNTRRILLEMYGNENYRQAGVFTISRCSNFIIRNIKFVGPGAIDVGGSDLISLLHSKNVWVDHCDFVDGIDGNLDITSSSDFVTLSWCTFSYTSRSYAHTFTNLIGSSETEPEGYLNTTLAYNRWGEGCAARMPMARIGVIHSLNNLFESVGAGQTINANYHSEILIQGNYFAAGVKKIFSDKNSVAYQWDDTNYVTENVTPPTSKGTVKVPYSYDVVDAQLMAKEVKTYAGAVMWKDITIEPTTDIDIPETDLTLHGNSYIVMGDDATPFDGKKVICDDITMTYGNDSQWQRPGSSSLIPDGYRCVVVGQNNPLDTNGQGYTTTKKNVPTKGTYYVFTPKTDGKLSVGAVVYKNKALYVTEDGAVKNDVIVNNSSYTIGTVIDTENITPIEIELEVKGGSTYHVFCNYSKMSFCGFDFTPSTTAIVLPDGNQQNHAVAYTIGGIRARNNSKGIIITNKKKTIR